jgi:uracil-DNA glycosylase family 4
LRAFGAISSQPALAKARALIQLRQEMQQALPQRKLVFGEGNPDARLVIVGEAPGRKEEVLGRPFAGRAGQLLNQLLAEMSLNIQVLRAQSRRQRLRCRGPTLSAVPVEAKTWV